VDFPSPFPELMSLLSVFSFDFLSLECLFKKSNHFSSVYIWSATPVAVAAVLVMTHTLGRNVPRDVLTNRLLLLGFLALPPVSLKLLQALDCVAIADKHYLRIDTSIDCDSKEFKTFEILDGLFITVYLSIPLVWLALLSTNRHRLNPKHSSNKDVKHALFVRDNDQGLSALRFLFAAYKPQYFYAECVEM
jgi:hypothetical protein